MTYREALKYIHSRLRFGSIPGLDSIGRLCEMFGNPQKDLKFVHVAGTNGKGSTATMISNIFIESGKKTGLFLSPFVLDFRERIQVDGEMVEKSRLADIISRLAPAVAKLDQENIIVTEFELITVAAFIYYKEKGCDIVVLEVGLGGRFDATNIIDKPEIAVITKISYDHTAILGDTLSQIAYEKSGIIKKGCTVVTFPMQEREALDVISKTADSIGCNLIIPDGFNFSSNGARGSTLYWNNRCINVSMIGSHQPLNAVTAAQAALLLGVDMDSICRGISRTRFPARLEIISSHPLVLLDGAHNPDGVSALCNSLGEISVGKNLTAVIGMLADKDYEKSLRLIAPMCSDIITLTPPNPRALKAKQLADAAKKYCNGTVRAARSYKNALEMAEETGNSIVICGSLYLAAAIRQKAIKYFNK